MGQVMLEALDRRGRAVQRLRVEQVPATIGRALDSDLQLDDPYVCPTHVRIVRDPDGRLVAEDAGSVNGVYAHTPPRRVARVALDTIDELRVGHTVLRVRHGDAPLAATLVDRGGPEPAAVRAPAALALCALAIALVGADAYLGSYGPHLAREAFGPAMVVLVLVLAWSTGWAFVTRVLSHQWHLLGHLAVACGFVIAMLVIGEIVDYAGFLVSSPRLIDDIELGLAVPLLAALLNGHLRLCAPTPVARRRLAALGTALIFVGLIDVVPRLLNRDSFSVELRFGSALRPIPRAWLPTRSVEQFVGSLDDVQADVDALAAAGR